jgi:hypothetical protein
MSFQEEIAQQSRPAERPALASGLLLHKICENPGAETAQLDEDWAGEHAGMLRFFVGGIDWFSNLTLMSMDSLFSRKDRTLELAERCGWSKMSDAKPIDAETLRAQWTAIARPQYFNAGQKRAMNFPKAALFILSCELAIQDLLEQITSRPENSERYAKLKSEVVAPEYVYKHMAIVPACWNVNDFNSKYLLRRVEARQGFLAQLAVYASQSGGRVFHQLADGQTVTFRTAARVKHFCDSSLDGCDPLGQIRSRRGRGGKGMLGSKRSAESEDIDLD